jgi:hypothetical protein
MHDRVYQNDQEEILHRIYGEVIVYPTARNAFNSHVYHAKMMTYGGVNLLFGYGHSPDAAINDLYSKMGKKLWDILTIK